MHRSSGKIHSLSVETIEIEDDFDVAALITDRYVSNPHHELIAKTDHKQRILIAYSKKQRRIIQFQLFDNFSKEHSTSLWDLMEILDIQCGHHSLITALRKCAQNILYAFEMERGFLFYSNESVPYGLVNIYGDQLNAYVESIDEQKVEKKTFIDSIIAKKDYFLEQLKFKKKKNTSNEPTAKKIFVIHNQSKTQKIAQFIVDGIVTYTFYMSDYYCLAEGEWLNDLIIDWYLMYLYSKVISDSDRKRTFIYSSLFFAVLRKEASETSSLTYASEQRFKKVQQFTGRVNIFEKDFVIIPVNENESHWYLIIICFPGLVDYLPIDDASQSMSSLSLTNDDDSDEKKWPCILIFDSLKPFKKKNDENLVKEYLSFQYRKYYNENRVFLDSDLRCDYPNVPKQTNLSDCGIFVLQYVESFFKNPITNFTRPINSLEKWFPPQEIRKKRPHLAHILRKLSRETVGNVTAIQFPELRFGEYSYSDVESVNSDYSDDSV